MSTIVYFKPADTSAGNSLVIRSDSPDTVRVFMEKQFPFLCCKKGVKFLECSHYRIVEKGVSFATMEFTSETKDEQILEVIEQFEIHYAQHFSTESVLLEPPTRTSLDGWGLL